MDKVDTQVKAIFEALRTTPNAFALSHGFSVPSMYAFANGRQNLGYDALVKMCKAEPRISAEYLLRGEGEPLRNNDRAIGQSSIDELKRMRDEIVLNINWRIEELEKASGNDTAHS